MMSSCIECSRNKSSGKDVVWPQLEALLAFDRDENSVVVHSMDRLARNLDDLRRLVRALTGKGVRVEFVTENLTFTGENTAMAKLLLSVMGAFAEFERALIRETREPMPLKESRRDLLGEPDEDKSPSLRPPMTLSERGPSRTRTPPGRADSPHRRPRGPSS